MDIPDYPENDFLPPEEDSNEEPQMDSFPPQEPIQAESSQEIQHLENELHLTLEEIARLQNALAEANMKLMVANSSATSHENDISVVSLMQPMVKEMRQPLVTIRGYLDLLLNESVGPLGAFQRRFVERIQKSVDHMEESLEKILHNRSEDKNEPGLYSQSFSVRKSTESALDLFISSIKSKQILLKINIPYEDIRLFADKENFENILNLLLTNATAALEIKGNLSIAVEEFLTQNPQEVIISIESSEYNVTPAEFIPVLPEMYKNQSLTLPGFGLPLEDIVRATELTSRMCGKLDLYSNSCGATVAKVRLPLVQGETL
jgi:signal transduction histidine kinase